MLKPAGEEHAGTLESLGFTSARLFAPNHGLDRHGKQSLLKCATNGLEAALELEVANNAASHLNRLLRVESITMDMPSGTYPHPYLNLKVNRTSWNTGCVHA